MRERGAGCAVEGATGRKKELWAVKDRRQRLTIEPTGYGTEGEEREERGGRRREWGCDNSSTYTNNAWFT